MDLSKAIALAIIYYSVGHRGAFMIF